MRLGEGRTGGGTSTRIMKEAEKFLTEWYLQGKVKLRTGSAIQATAGRGGGGRATRLAVDEDEEETRSLVAGVYFMESLPLRSPLPAFRGICFA